MGASMAASAESKSYAKDRLSGSSSSATKSSPSRRTASATSGVAGPGGRLVPMSGGAIGGPKRGRKFVAEAHELNGKAGASDSRRRWEYETPGSMRYGEGRIAP